MNASADPAAPFVETASVLGSEVAAARRSGMMKLFRQKPAASKAGRQVDLSLGAGSGVSLNGMASASRRG